MNIIIASHSYWPNLDGVEMVNQYLAEGLKKRGHNVTIYTIQYKGMKEYEVHNEIPIYRFKVGEFLKYPVGEKKRYQKCLLSDKKNTDAIVTVCGHSFASCWFLPVIDKFQGKKILYMHGMRDEKVHFRKIRGIRHFTKEFLLTVWYYLYFHFYWKQIMKYDACIHIFQNDSSFNYFSRHGYRKNNVIMNCCENELFTEKQEGVIQKKYYIRNKYFLYVGNYCKGKNQIEALRAFQQINSDQIELVCIGNDRTSYYYKLVKEYRKLSEQEQISQKNSRMERVHLLVGLDREDVVDLIKNSYACLMTSFSEYFPISIAESMAAGRPFISTYTGIVSLLPGGVIAHDFDEICYWLNYFVDHEEYTENLGKIAKRYALENMNLQSKIDQFERILKE